MIWVMALTKIGENPDQSPWLMAKFEGKPSTKIGETFRFKDEPNETWLVADLFPDDIQPTDQSEGA